MVQRVVGRVLVLGHLVAERTAPEAHGLTAGVVDREHHPSAELVLEPIGPVHERQPRGDEIVALHALLLEHPAEVVPLVGGPTDLEPPGRVAVEAPAAEVLAGGAGLGRLEQQPVVLVDRRAHRLGELGVARLVLARPLVVVPEGDAGFRSEALHRLDEVEVVHLPHERDRVTRRLAAEAPVQTHLGVHVERRGLLLVERAQAAVAGADLLQRQVLADERDDVGRLPDPHHVLVEDSHSGAEATRSTPRLAPRRPGEGRRVASRGARRRGRGRSDPSCPTRTGPPSPPRRRSRARGPGRPGPRRAGGGVRRRSGRPGRAGVGSPSRPARRDAGRR